MSPRDLSSSSRLAGSPGHAAVLQAPPEGLQSPDFSAIEIAARHTREGRNDIFARIGHLTVNWSNTESLLIHVLRQLMNVSLKEAVIVFSTLNTSRARLEMIRRLAAVTLQDATAQKELESIIRRFNASTKLRNEINHSIYNIDNRGIFISQTIIRPKEAHDGLSIIDIDKIDEGWIKRMDTELSRLFRLNVQIWRFIARLEELRR